MYIDSRAIYNFSERLVKTLKIPMKERHFSVILKDDKKVQGIGKCKGIELLVQRMTIVQNFLPFCLERVNIIVNNFEIFYLLKE